MNTPFVWQPTLGAIPDATGTLFRVYAPKADVVHVKFQPPGADWQHALLLPEGDGYFAQHLANVGAGTLYLYQLDQRGAYPDPVSRFQPRGVHGPSQVVDPRAYSWQDGSWAGITAHDLVIYELHVGTMTCAGTWSALIEQLPYLRDLGITAIELLPIADFPGQRNWGYDGVSLFAPTRCYGSPDELRRFVDLAHQHGLAVLLDVVYNHLGPDGNYLGMYTDHFFAKHHRTPWGAAVNVDGELSEHVRRFIIENAFYWMHEYHFDGLRFDATPAIIDHSPQHIISEIAERIRTAIPQRVTHFIAEDDRNDVAMVRARSAGGWGLDATWSDDFHHLMRRLLTGDHVGYYRDYRANIDDLAATLRQGWLFCGEHSAYRSASRGTIPEGTQPSHFVIYLQNHDQIGNRPFGDRLHHEIEASRYRAASMLFLLAPQTPMLFMGQEWAASSPFQFFTDHHEELGRLIDAGRRREYSAFCGYEDPSIVNAMPHPQAEATFLRSQLAWSELTEAAPVLRCYQAALALRRQIPRTEFTVTAVGDQAIMLQYSDHVGVWCIVVSLSEEPCVVHLPSKIDTEWEIVLTTEDESFCHDPQPIRWDGLTIQFARSGAIVLRGDATNI